MAKTSYQRQKEKIAELEESNRKLRGEIYKIVIDNDAETIIKWKIQGNLERAIWKYGSEDSVGFVGLMAMTENGDNTFRHFENEKLI